MMPEGPTISAEKESAAIDMVISMAVEELAQALGTTVEEALPQFLQSRTCAVLCDPSTKMWWDGPSSAAAACLAELRAASEAARRPR